MCDNFIRIEDNYPKYAVNNFTIPRHYEKDIESVVIPHGLIIDRIERMARDIHENFNAESMTILCILKGGFKFCQDLMNCLQIINRNSGKSIQLRLEFLRLKSYTNDQQDSHVQVIGGEILEDLNGKNVLVVEDIIDSGKTMEKLLNTLSQYSPKSVKVASLLVKRRDDSTGYKPDYYGYEIPNIWITGYGGFDFNEHFRDLDHICIINKKAREKYGVK